MFTRTSSVVWSGLGAAACVVTSAVLLSQPGASVGIAQVQPVGIAQVQPAEAGKAAIPLKLEADATDHVCTADLTLAGVMHDILSNALGRGLKVEEAGKFLEGAREKYSTGEELFRAAAKELKIDEAVLAAEVERFKHCTCRLGPMPDGRPAPAAEREHGCDVDLTSAGMMNDVLMNVLSARQIAEMDARVFTDDADVRYESGAELLKAAALHFKIEEAVLAAEVAKYKHCNCTLDVMLDDGEAGKADAKASVDESVIEVSVFAKDVTLHVVLHELGHALIREFDIPVLGNEESAADAFATYYLTTYLPDRAVDVLKARVTSLMIEANESSDNGWRGEHEHDGRRAFQIASLAMAADHVKYKPVADVVGMRERDIQKARDYGAENRRAWRRVLMPLWMPEATASNQVQVIYNRENAFMKRLCEDGLAHEVEIAAKRFDWHSGVTIRFVNGTGGAGWNRSKRTVTVNSEYVRRFIGQGEKGLVPAAGAK